MRKYYMKQWKNCNGNNGKKTLDCVHAVCMLSLQPLITLHTVIPSPQIIGFFANSLMLCPEFKLYLITFASSRSCDWELQRTLYSVCIKFNWLGNRVKLKQLTA